MTLRLILNRVASAATVFCAFSACAAAADGSVNSGTAAAPAPTTDRMIVKYRSGTTPFLTRHALAAASVAANRQGVQMNHLRTTTNGAHVFQLSQAMTHAQVEILAANFRAGDANIEYAEPDRLMQPLFVPNDPLFGQQWDLFDPTAGVRAPAAWDRSTGAGVRVAVIDTGVRPHADLVGNLLPGYNFISDSFVSGGPPGSGRSNDASDLGDAVTANYCGTGSQASNSSWHGTHVSGIVAATAGNAVGVTGVAFNAKVVPLRVLGRCGGYSSDIADAIVWGAGIPVLGVPVNPNPAKVLNMSLGGDGFCGTTLQTAISAARAKGAVVVVAAGNYNADASTTFPANCSGVIAVAATGKSGGKASYSNFGSNVTLAAPGGDSGAGILSTLNAGATTPGADSYAFYMGTSMATPVVSGVVALMFAVNSSLTPDQVTTMLKASARPFPAPCVKCGAGIVDANAAVALAAAAAVTVAPPTAVTGNNLNHSLETAQTIATVPALVSEVISSASMSDFFQVPVGERGKVNVTLTAGATSGFGLGVLTLSGQSLYLQQGVVGKQQLVQITNQGSTATQIVIRVFRSAGDLGAFQLLLVP